MMKEIEIQNYQIGEIPILEICRKQEQNNSELPLLFLYHGWTSCKEDMLEIAKQLAGADYRMIIADCYGHGSRKQQDLRMWDVDLMFQTIRKTVDEFPNLFVYYQKSSEKKLTQFAVAGVSMGAMIVNALICQFDAIPAAVSLMGAASLKDLPKHFQADGMQSLIEANQFFHPEQSLPDRFSLEHIIEEKEQALADLSEQLVNYDLGQDISRIKQRIMYFWHGRRDPLVPCRITVNFEQRTAPYPEAENLIFSYGQKQGHLVPLQEWRRVTNFLIYLKKIHFDKDLFNRAEAIEAMDIER